MCFSVVPAVLLLLFLPWFPESSRFLLISRRDRLASRAHLGKIVPKESLDREFEKLVAEAEASQKVRSSVVHG